MPAARTSARRWRRPNGACARRPRRPAPRSSAPAPRSEALEADLEKRATARRRRAGEAAPRPRGGAGSASAQAQERAIAAAESRLAEIEAQAEAAEKRVEEAERRAAAAEERRRRAGDETARPANRPPPGCAGRSRRSAERRDGDSRSRRRVRRRRGRRRRSRAVDGAACRRAGRPRSALVSRTPLSQSASFWAQGGLAAALEPGDSPERHAADTIAAGRGLCRPSAVQVLVEEAPAAVRELRERGRRLRPRRGRRAGARPRGRAHAAPHRPRRRQPDRTRDHREAGGDGRRRAADRRCASGHRRWRCGATASAATGCSPKPARSPRRRPWSRPAAPRRYGGARPTRAARSAPDRCSPPPPAPTSPTSSSASSTRPRSPCPAPASTAC